MHVCIIQNVSLLQSYVNSELSPTKMVLTMYMKVFLKIK